MRDFESSLKLLLRKGVQVGYFVFRYLKYNLTITSLKNFRYTFGEECWEAFLIERVNREDVVREVCYKKYCEVPGKFSESNNWNRRAIGNTDPVNIWVVSRGVCYKMSDIIEHVSSCSRVEDNFEIR